LLFLNYSLYLWRLHAESGLKKTTESDSKEADGAGLGYTTFEAVSGGNFYPGMLVRELGK